MDVTKIFYTILIKPRLINFDFYKTINLLKCFTVISDNANFDVKKYYRTQTNFTWSVMPQKNTLNVKSVQPRTNNWGC